MLCYVLMSDKYHTQSKTMAGVEESASNSQSLHRSPKKKDNFWKRRNTSGCDNFKSHQKKRRKDDFDPPTVFLLGGNYHDPLNLKNMKTNDLQNQTTPQSSPLPISSHKEKVEVLIPPNLSDPLNLAGSESLNESDLISPTTFKRNKRRRTSSETEIIESKCSEYKNYCDKFKDDSYLFRRSMTNSSKYNNRDKYNNDKIVSPVVPQGSSNRYSRNNFKSFNSHSNKNKDNYKDNYKCNERKNKTTNDLNNLCDSQEPSCSKSNLIINNKNERFQDLGCVKSAPLSKNINKNERFHEPSCSKSISYSKNNKNERFLEQSCCKSVPSFNKTYDRFQDKSYSKSIPVSNKSERCHESGCNKSHVNIKNERFQYGNYNRYYGYRNINEFDSRIKLFPKDLFEGKNVLDIGCNVGHVTLKIAQDYAPKKIVGIDIDNTLIVSARSNIRHYITEQIVKQESFPISLPIICGPIVAIPGQSQDSTSFPNNIEFHSVNYVQECLEVTKDEFDCVLCLSVTKWVHLNWGDSGVKLLFQRIFFQLRPGGCLILEPQPWSSYNKKNKMTSQAMEHFRSIRLKPEHFNEYLLKDVGFKSCELLGTPAHNSKGFQRPIYLYTKAAKK